MDWISLSLSLSIRSESSERCSTLIGYHGGGWRLLCTTNKPETRRKRLRVGRERGCVQQLRFQMKVSRVRRDFIGR
eukprot:scaffold61142_cov57-Cyclotella_meneghiniana.AAC.2